MYPASHSDCAEAKSAFLADARGEIQRHLQQVNGLSPGFGQVQGGQAPEPYDYQQNSGATLAVRILSQLIFGLCFFCCIVRNYPKLMAPTQASARIQQENEVMALCSTSPQNCCLSLCCSGPRAALTFDRVGLIDYWLGLCLMTLFPCPTIYFMNSCTDLNERLGGQRKNCITGLCCAFFCHCCVIAQDAEALDLATGAQTGFCGVTQPMDMGQYGPQQGMMQQQQQQMYAMPDQYQRDQPDLMNCCCASAQRPMGPPPPQYGSYPMQQGY